MYRNVGDSAGGGDVAGIARESGTLAGPIGTIRMLGGSALVVRASGVTVPAYVGISVYQNDVIVTDVDGSVGITFQDGTAFNLGASTRMILDEFVYDASNGTLK